MPVDLVQTPEILLVDNGSLRPQPTLHLRRIARRLSSRIPYPATATSLLHSDRIDPDRLEGKPAVLLFDEISRRLEAGKTHFIILPCFIGPSLALTDYIPGQLNERRTRHPRLRVVVADSLARTGPREDLRLARIVSHRVRDVITGHSPSTAPDVIVVDHGSPVRAVAALRDRIATEVAGHLAGSVHSVHPASMERREDPEFAFNEPLLETALMETGRNGRPVIVSLLFLSPGRHAGPDGDITRICREARAARPGLDITLTPPIGVDPGIIDILADRTGEALAELTAQT
ncbi:MAG: CbiX/SirB N-terminal domain-containing protein [Opitutaceae bacterium]